MKAGLSASAAALMLLKAVEASPLGARALEERAITCDAILPSMQADLSRATRFCTVYLQLIPVTLTTTATATRFTQTTTQAAYTTTTQIITPDEIVNSLYTTIKQSSTVTPETKTVTATVTSTAYMNPYGSTIAVMKREAEPSHVELAARAIVTPTYLKRLRKTDIRAACQCLDLAAPTYTRKMTVDATSTATKDLMRTMRSTTTLDAVTRPTTLTITEQVVVTDAAPLSTATAYAIQQVNSCPPGTTSTWLCPEMTGDDDGSDPNYKNCAVVAQDGYSGKCLYWADDGSPAASTLRLGDGSGDSNMDQTRSASYGDDQMDDCPSWADWTCGASAGPQKRSTLEKLAEEHYFQKRGYFPKKVTLAEHKRGGKRKMPKGLKRGGKYVHASQLRLTRNKSS